MIDYGQVTEIRATWGRADASPWAGFVMRHTVKTADGDEMTLWGYEAQALVEVLRAAGARLVESVEGWTRVVRITNYELGITNEEAAQVRPRPSTVEEAVEQMTAKGKESRPGLAGRLDSAAALVVAGKVALPQPLPGGGEPETEPAAKVSIYHVTAESCTCPDFVHRGGWCKHRLAVRMARHLAASGYNLPRESEDAPVRTPQISEANLALIASGRVIDEARRADEAFRRSSYGAERRAIEAAANGRSIAAADWQRLNGGGR